MRREINVAALSAIVTAMEEKDLSYIVIDNAIAVTPFRPMETPYAMQHPNYEPLFDVASTPIFNPKRHKVMSYAKQNRTAKKKRKK